MSHQRLAGPQYRNLAELRVFLDGLSMASPLRYQFRPKLPREFASGTKTFSGGKMKIQSICRKVCFALGVLLISTGPALAGSASTSMGVSASVATNCVFKNSPAIAFGTYDTITGAQVDGSGTISIACTKGTVATIALDNGGNHANATGTQRAMKSGSNYLNYDIYQDSAFATFWGTSTNAEVEPAAPNATTQTFTAYAKIPSAQDQPQGSYSDTVGVTVSF